MHCNARASPGRMTTATLTIFQQARYDLLLSPRLGRSATATQSVFDSD
jgi:hypothetical protein